MRRLPGGRRAEARAVDPQQETTPMVAYRVRTVTIGVNATFLTVVALVVFALLPGHGPIDWGVFAAGIVLAIVGGLTMRWLVPWDTLLRGPLGNFLFYAWSVADVVLVCVAIAATGGSRSESFLLLALPISFFAMSYPRRGQLALLVFTEVAYATTLVLGGWQVTAAVFTLRSCLLALIAYMASFVSDELQRELADHARARRESEERAELLVVAVNERRAADERLLAIMANSDDMIMLLDADGTIAHVNPAVARVFGAPGLLDVGDNVLSRVHPDDVEECIRRLGNVVETGGLGTPVEMRVQHSDSSWRTIEAVGRRLPDFDESGGIVINARDVTEKARLREELSRQALHDHLTGLPNRALFLDRLEHALSRVARDGSLVAVLFVDLDHFKLVNDTMGHSSGDTLLIEISQRMRSVMRPVDTVARFGGDEFVVLCEDVEDERHALAIAERLESTLSAPFVIANREFFVTMSVGLAFGREADTEPETLLRQADSAMYSAKARGRRRVEVFDERLHDEATVKLETQTMLRRGLERSEFELWYQPEVDLSSGKIMGAEALLRWRHPKKGIVAPGDFIHTAEETGLIVPIGAWVLREACIEAARWPAGDAGPLFVSVNLSARQLTDPDLVPTVAQALHDSGLDASRLVLEITESAVMQDMARSIDVLHTLKDLGTRLAADDFGTGYSSLSYLQAFPIDFLKIDRSFVVELASDENARAIVAAIITMAHSLSMQTVAEGTEEVSQIEALRALGCDIAQGYHYARPMQPSAFDAMLDAQYGQSRVA